MNFFEQELRKMFMPNNTFEDPKFIGKVCYEYLSNQTVMKIEFTTMGTHQKYEGIKASVIDKHDGVIDTVILKFSDIWGENKQTNCGLSGGLAQHVWIYNGKTEWYGYEPSKVDYKILADTVKTYSELFKEQTQNINNSQNFYHQI